jgi:pyochelin biosynthetic protein PchC
MATMIAERWIRRFSPAPDARSMLVCLPHAGGSASYYVPIARALAPRVDVLAVQYPGRQDRRNEPCVETVTELADQIFAVLRPILDRPVTLFGHSMGASVAFELALRLEGAGVVPTALFASGRRAPSSLRQETTHQWPDRELIGEVIALSGTGSELLDDEEIMRMVLPAIRSDYTAVETYRWTPGTMLTCPIHAFIGDVDPKVTVEEALPWDKHTEGEFDLKVFSGGHFYIDQHLSEIVDAIRDHVDQRLASEAK